MAEERDEEIAALKARLADLEANRSASPPQPPAAAKPVGAGKTGCIAVVIVIGVLIAVASMCSSPSEQSSITGTTGPFPSTSATPAPAAWSPPEGYQLYPMDRGGRAGIKWVKARNSECQERCWAMEVITEHGCPSSMYASITLLGRNDDNVGWTNDTAQGVEAGEVTRLVFNTYEDGVKSARLAELNCY